jgi:hypothetical protein
MAQHRRPPPAARLALLALLALAAGAAAQGGGIPLLDAAPSQSTALSSVGGCGSGNGIGPNMDECMLQDNIKVGDQHEYTFTVPERMEGDAPFSILITAKSVGGLVQM